MENDFMKWLYIGRRKKVDSNGYILMGDLEFSVSC